VALTRALVLRALGLGDLLTAVPALRALQRGLAGVELHLAGPASYRPLLELAGLRFRLLPADGVTGVPSSLPWEGTPPDLAVNLHGAGPQSHRLLLGLGPGRLVAYGCPAAGVAGPGRRPDEHERVRWCRLVEEGLGLPADPADLLLQAGVPRASGPAVVHPGAASAARRWPPDRFATVARWLVDQGHRVVVTGGPDEELLGLRVARAAGLERECVLAGRTGTRQLAQLVAAAPVVVCGDTGVAHLASAFATPSVVLHGPTPPSAWGPPEEGPHVALWRGPGAGDPHADEPDPALLRITPADVVAALASVGATAPRPTRASAPGPQPR